ncbi:MAG: ribosome biogenesis GTP-binding protein YihA/YsxC [SAR324 cluster bacterium]|nr:ribosome biogenesis GTP-binding protein YihA/YsxC [SAR324 cluster bacterium]
MKIKSAGLLESAAGANQFPDLVMPEIAFAGRSNVGKSTLINSLLTRKNLVKTSSTPGKTRLINFFLINEIFCLVDLPGYGFAKVPAAMRESWRKLIETYLSRRENLRGVVLIIDIRHGPTAQDRQLKSWLDFHQRPMLVVASKSDKLSRGKCASQLQKIKKDLELPQLPLPHSSLNKEGRGQIWKAMDQWLFPA